MLLAVKHKYIYNTDFVADVCPIVCGKVSSLGMDPTVDKVSGDWKCPKFIMLQHKRFWAWN